MKLRSRSRQRTYRARARLVAAILEQRPWCEIRVPHVCRGRATDVHEPLTRARGGSILDEQNTLTTCRPCHDHVHTHPAEAKEHGWLHSSRH